MSAFDDDLEFGELSGVPRRPGQNPATPQPQPAVAPQPTNPLRLSVAGQWKDSRFYLAEGVQFGDFMMVCPYGPHLVEIERDDSHYAYDYYEDEPSSPYFLGWCEHCDREVEIDYEPSAVIAPTRVPAHIAQLPTEPAANLLEMINDGMRAAETNRTTASPNARLDYAFPEKGWRTAGYSRRGGGRHATEPRTSHQINLTKTPEAISPQMRDQLASLVGSLRG
jgi:hypothetical protein